MQQVTHKQGDTFSLSCSWKDPNGTAINLTGYTILSKVRVTTGTTFTDTLTSTITTAASGLFTLSATPTQTASWPLTSGQYGKLYCDVQFTSPTGVVTSSDTFEVVVVEEITR
jgi:hypothetical protein